MLKLLERARERAVGVPALAAPTTSTPSRPEQEPWFPGDEYVERRIRAYIRWNAAIMVSRANRPGMGGRRAHRHLMPARPACTRSVFNHFFRGKDHGESGDQVFFQGHASPGIYARAFLEGRLGERDLDSFRQELSGPGRGLRATRTRGCCRTSGSTRRCPWASARCTRSTRPGFNRYLLNREIKDTSRSRVWAFLGDGETDEPESLGAIGLAAREELDNLIFVINCNLQRLDGRVRGNGKIIQEAGVVLPRRRLERDQGGVGPRLGPAAGQGHGRPCW